MAQAWFGVRIPRIVHTCCGKTYDTKNINTVDFFRCFAHKSLKSHVFNEKGKLTKVKFCITVWLICKNNGCITSFTHYYDKTNRLIKKTQTSGLKYILKLSDKFLDNIPLRVKIPKIESASKKYLWRYTDKHPTKNFVSNVYDLNDKKVGETPPQSVYIYKLTS